MIEKVDDTKVFTFVKKYFPDFDFKDDPFVKMFCYKKDKRIIGFISYSIIYERAELNYIVVDNHYRKKGIGFKLLKFALDDLKNNMVENFSLEVSVNNLEAINFYLKSGFEIKAIRKNYYEDSDAYLMVLEVI